MPDGLTPYQCLTGKKLNLSALREWGSTVWVRTEKKDKLGGQHVEEGRWVGVDVKSKGIHVYWPKKWSVTVERNLY